MARKPTPDQRPPQTTETDELRERIERLEERLDHRILGDDGMAELDSGIDKSASADPLRKAVERSNVKRGGKA